MEARNELLEFLFRNDDVVPCAERAVEWLFEHGRAKHVLCLAMISGRHLVRIASQGLSRGDASGFAVDLEDRSDPLVLAFRGLAPVRFEDAKRLRGVPVRPPLDVFPLRSESLGESAAGLLLVGATRETAPTDEVSWLARTLGEKLVRLGLREALVEGRLGHERSLASRATLLQDVLNAVSDPILLTDTQGKVLLGNARAEWLLVAREDNNEGRRRAVELNNLYLSSALSSQAIAGETARREVTLVDPIAGSDILFELLSSTVKSPVEGTTVVSILRNVTDLGRASREVEESTQRLKGAEREARAERRRVELIIDSVADPIVVTDPDGEIVLLNAPAEKLFTVSFGMTAEGKKRISANDARFSSFASGLLFGGHDRRHRGEIALIDPVTGLQIPVEAIAGSILSEAGELTAVVTILHDRRESVERARLYDEIERAKKELEQRVQAATRELADQNEKLRRQALELERASAHKSQFLASVSHEFRTPLNAIMGSAHILLAGVAGNLNPQQRKNVDRIHSNSQSLVAIINEILDITKIEAGRVPVRPSLFKLDALVQEVLSELAPLVALTGLEVRSELGPRLPSVRTDRQKVKQILLNLLNNALKFTTKGSVRIAGSRERSPDRVSIHVVDTGVGIAPTDQERIFEDFQQVDVFRSGAYGGGSGLGLSICRRLAALLGAEIGVASKLGEGSTFTLTIPRRLKKQR